MVSLLVWVVVLDMMMLRRMELRNNMGRRRRMRKNHLICLRQGKLVLVVVLMFLNEVSQLSLLSGEKLLFTLILNILSVLSVLTDFLTKVLTKSLLYKEASQYIVSLRLAPRLRQLGGQTAQDGVHHAPDLGCVPLTDEPPQDGVPCSLLGPAPRFLRSNHCNGGCGGGGGGGGGGHQQDED